MALHDIYIVEGFCMFKKKQWICNFMALMLLLTGMCIDEVKADSIFLCPQTAVIIGTETADAVLSDADVEVTEILCARTTGTGSQIAAQITNGRRTVKLSIVFLCVAFFSLLLSNFYTVERIAEFPCLSERAAVLKFIHNTDGKK